ncbi:MAG TPA: hypothetical protein PKG63_01825 [Bacteroidales bacterium]|jgi:hypothetical protein|nr:hypothetical protein [Bacteroidales bacterium]
MFKLVKNFNNLLTMNEIAVIIIVLLTGGVVLATAYYLLKLFFDNERTKRTWEYKTEHMKVTVPLRLQAYERMILFMERMSPNSLIVRLQSPTMTSRQLQMDMLSLIRAEFEHNLAQQLYISKQAWDVVVSAKENVIKIINIAADEIEPGAPYMELSQKIMAQWIVLNPTPIRAAIDFLKDEANQLF